MFLINLPIFDFLEPLGEALANFLKGFNIICSNIFRFGNVILFIVFLIMGINLLVNAKDKEYQEKIFARNLELAKRKGRIGTGVCIVLSVAFLSKGLLVFLLWCFKSFSLPLVFLIPYLTDFYYQGDTLDALNAFELVNSSIFLLMSMISLISLIAIAFGIYLILFNKRILRSKLKPYKVLGAGLLLAIIFGFPLSLRLMI